MSDRKGAADVRAALMRGEARLAFGGALPGEESDGKLEVHGGPASAQGGDHAAGEEFRLVESALAAPGFE
jgi:hypothetical protein